MTPANFGIDLLGQTLDVAALRHRVVAQNVANVNTPNYKRREVAFEGELKKALTGSLSGATAGPSAIVPKVVETGNPERADGNTVDIDREMGDLTKNALLYQAVSQVLASRLASLRAAISGR